MLSVEPVKMNGSVAPAGSASPLSSVHAPPAWRGLGGRVPSAGTIEFDRQLDKISLWLETWNHEKRCGLLEALVMRSSYHQLKFLWTVLQPALHRDFMYTARKEFPAQTFSPVSTHTSRHLKNKLTLMHQDNFHRVASAHFQHYRQVREVALPRETTLPNIQLRRSVDARQLSSGSPCRQKNMHPGRPAMGHRQPSVPRLHRSAMQSSSSSRQSSCLSLPRALSRLGNSPRDSDCSCHQGEPTQQEPSMSQSSSRAEHLHLSPPCVRFMDMPIRRHIQDEQSPQAVETLEREYSRLSTLSNQTSLHSPSPEFSLRERKRRREEQNVKKPLCAMPLKSSKLPAEALQVLLWYSEIWNDLQKNEFLHKFLLKLDPRQQYFLSSFLSVKHSKDFIALLPQHLALKILSYLLPSELITASMVSRFWYKCCTSNELWKQKCSQIKLDIPVAEKNPNWKHVYRENLSVQQNWTQGRCSVVDCKGHSDKVLSVAIDSKRMATGSADKTIKLWDLHSGRCVQTLQGHLKGVWSLRFFTKTLLISGSYDCTIKVWNLRSGSCVRTLLGHEGPVWALVLRGNSLVSASQDKTAKVWDASRCYMLQTLAGHHGPVFAVDMDELGQLIATGSADKTVRLWDAATGVQKKLLHPPLSAAFMGISLSRGFLACCHGNTILVYHVGDDGTSAKLLRTYEEHEKRIESLCLKMKQPSRYQGGLISAGKDGMLKYWDLTKEKSVRTFEGHTKQINYVTCDQLRILTASYDNKIKIWDFGSHPS